MTEYIYGYYTIQCSVFVNVISIYKCKYKYIGICIILYIE